MIPDSLKCGSRSNRSTALLMLLASCFVLVGCGGYVLEGRAVRGEYSSAELVDADDPRLDAPGMSGVNLELIRDPDSLGRRVATRTNSKGDGVIRLSISDFGVGFLDEEWDVRVLKDGSEYAIARVRLPFESGSKRLLVTIRPGDGRGRNSLGVEAERMLQQEDRQIPRDSAIFR